MIKKLTGTAHHSKNLDLALLLLRVGIASMMLFHGLPKLMQLFGEGAIQFADPIGLGEDVSLMLAVFAEFFCSLLILFGVVTRLAVIPPIITMLVAVLIVHFDDGFGGMEIAFHYLLVYIVLLIAGSGKFSVDKWISKN